ncbi:MAG: hypothetical protein QOC70_1338 [Verrucomicrobiota bacterium]|jgi:hypothetical protein
MPRVAVGFTLRHSVQMRPKMAIMAVPAVTLLTMMQAVFSQGIEPPPKKAPNALIESGRALRENPQMQQRLRDQSLQELKDIYGDFVKEQRLSAQQTKRFYQLLLDEAVEGFIEETERMENVTEETGVAEASPSRAPELNRQLRLLLGDNAATRLEQYQKTGTERLILAQYRHELRMGDIALPDDKAKALFQIICEEKARTPPLPFDPRSENADVRKALEGDNAQRYYEAEADLSRRILSRAGSVLNEEQYEALAKFQDRHLAAEKAGIEALRRTTQRESSESP